MEKFNKIDLTAKDSVPREMGMRRAVFLLIASLLLWCGSMLLVLDLANASGNQGQVALIGLFWYQSAAVGYGLIFLKSPLGSPVRLARGSTISSQLKSLSEDLKITAQTAICSLAHLWIRRTVKQVMQTKATSKKNDPSV